MKKSTTQIVQDIIDNARATTNEELENEFDFSASEAGYSEDEIEAAKKSSWFPWIKNPAAVALGRRGGQAKTEAKKASSAENGKLGGRPKKAK